VLLVLLALLVEEWGHRRLGLAGGRRRGGCGWPGMTLFCGLVKGLDGMSCEGNTKEDAGAERRITNRR